MFKLIGDQADLHNTYFDGSGEDADVLVTDAESSIAGVEIDLPGFGTGSLEKPVTVEIGDANVSDGLTQE